jgi:ATP-dependent Clp protease protease subunit
MSVKKTTQTTTDKILNSDIYDLTAFVDDIKKINIDGIYIKHSAINMTMEKIVAATDRDNYLDPFKAKEMGLIDNVIEPKKKIAK